MEVQFQLAPLAEMDPAVLYRVLQLRSDVFVVEQACAYPELDGRDLEPGSLQVWADDASQVVAALRILRDDDVLRIGRVVAHPDRRGSGLARDLFRFALDRCDEIAPGLRIVLNAQEPLQGWYESFGFERAGESFLEDGIPHVPMRR